MVKTVFKFSKPSMTDRGKLSANVKIKLRRLSIYRDNFGENGTVFDSIFSSSGNIILNFD